MKKIYAVLLGALLGVSTLSAVGCSSTQDACLHEYETHFSSELHWQKCKKCEDVVGLAYHESKSERVSEKDKNYLVCDTCQTKFDEKEGRLIKTVGQTFQGTDVVYPDELWSTPAYEYCEELDFGMPDTEGVKAIFMTSPIRYNGKPTKVMAYIGFPENASKTEKVPAIVLVHGASGTAVPQWVKYWNDQGFAAISLDVEGAEPIDGVSNENTIDYHKPRNRYENDPYYTAGPTQHGFGDGNKPIEEQFVYHATSATILATSLISSFDCVDTQKVGITGISWGSVLCSIVASYDDRLTFGMPIYGGLSLAESCADFEDQFEDGYDMTDPVQAQYSAQMQARWDTLDGLKQSNCDMFFVTSTADPYFSMDIASRSGQAVGGQVAYKFNYPHSQSYGAYEENIVDFAKHACGMEGNFVEITKHPTPQDNRLQFVTHGEVGIDTIKVFTTQDEKPHLDAKWESQSVAVVVGKTEYEIPIKASKHAFVQISYNHGKQVCSYIFTGPSEDITLAPVVYDQEITSTLSFKDDFTKNLVEDSHAFRLYNVTNHDQYGNINYAECLVPSKVMSAQMNGGDGYLLYRINATDGNAIRDLKISTYLQYTRWGNYYWYRADGKLGANVYIEYSYDNRNYYRVYDMNLDNADENGVGWIVTHNVGEVDCKLNPTVDLSAYAHGKTEIYIRVYIQHLTGEELNIPAWNGTIEPWYFAVNIYDIGVNANFMKQE